MPHITSIFNTPCSPHRSQHFPCQWIPMIILKRSTDNIVVALMNLRKPQHLLLNNFITLDDVIDFRPCWKSATGIVYTILEDYPPSNHSLIESKKIDRKCTCFHQRVVRKCLDLTSPMTRRLCRSSSCRSTIYSRRLCKYAQSSCRSTKMFHLNNNIIL